MDKMLYDYKRNYISTMKYEGMEEKSFQDSVRQSLEFLQTFSNTEDKKDYAFDCLSGTSSELGMLEHVSNLLSKVTPTGGHLESIFKENGDPKELAEILQLAIAPTCVNDENRVKLPYEIDCDNNSTLIEKIKTLNLVEEKKTRAIRERVLVNLLQNRGLGNSYDIPGQKFGHINTIVGIRFDQATQSCQYLIRDSGDASSKWLSENGIVKNIRNLSEVWKK